MNNILRFTANLFAGGAGRPLNLAPGGWESSAIHHYRSGRLPPASAGTGPDPDGARNCNEPGCHIPARILSTRRLTSRRYSASPPGSSTVAEPR